ncbi:cysteine rich repeat-containing protein [Leptospira sp. 2 VSF19]|uniref:Cysteine rich repeat-containing protein n=1 Tax=Leptospira soteropolitanensis TaxID=2950025 RepID=A0AAW5VH32_9LEPT|nr:cysteine rich repeat-containing protein [Leptospira soteropolitanensis]MCW7493549.1 cysteine rich repeat-containing protein [Leptospira soteropolitanensis]MCW7500920.1 cysteine rich repeat-containing protein [Leptospira soteropolitanensis]MCW7523400.1 cysteine rich repeat-containing protein [Leptospira soteropolitanensis]MCW7527261.1 cysteine rich repeat-containing protein [Leptospira soteropolitanensis]MCW7531118.1 cysteine rich repeat-containing protein [Leptospira soteropolitanensis]
MKLYSILLIFLFSFTLFAETKSIYDVCKQEIVTYCQGIKLTKASVLQCLKERGKNLSDVCDAGQNALSESMKNRSQNFCKEDVSEYCRWVIPGGGRILKCLFENEKKISNQCKVILNEI